MFKWFFKHDLLGCEISPKPYIVYYFVGIDSKDLESMQLDAISTAIESGILSVESRDGHWANRAWAWLARARLEKF